MIGATYATHSSITVPMLSSANSTKPPLAESQLTRPPQKTYACAVKGTTKVSLIHTGISTTSENTSTSTATEKTFQTAIFRSARFNDAFLYDISVVRAQYTDQQCMALSKEQHPNSYAAFCLNDGPRRYMEVYQRQHDDINEILEHGIYFEKLNLRVLPRKAIADSSKIVHIQLSHIPFLPREEVLAGLRTSLTPVGQLLDVGIYTDPVSTYFMGSGYAVLDTSNTTDSTADWAPLTHVIRWEETHDVFHATWNNMPTWCRYCHKEGHVKTECPLSKARILCYSCHQNGHRSFECPKKGNGPPFKKQRNSQKSSPDAITSNSPQTTVKAKQKSSSPNISHSTLSPVLDLDAFTDELDDDYVPSDASDHSDNASTTSNMSEDIEPSEVENLTQDQQASLSSFTQGLPLEHSQMNFSTHSTQPNQQYANPSVTQLSDHSISSPSLLPNPNMSQFPGGMNREDGSQVWPSH